MPSKIIVGWDGSDGSRDALALGQTLAGATGRELLLLWVLPADPPAWDERSEETARRLAEEAGTTLKAAPVAAEVERRVIFGQSVARGLQLHGGGEDAAAIVVGCPERGRVGQIEVGTVAQRLLHGSPCAVALAPRGHVARPADGFERIVVGYSDSDEARAALRAAAGLAHACRSAVRVVWAMGEPLIDLRSWWPRRRDAPRRADRP